MFSRRNILGNTPKQNKNFENMATFNLNMPLEIPECLKYYFTILNLYYNNELCIYASYV